MSRRKLFIFGLILIVIGTACTTADNPEQANLATATDDAIALAPTTNPISITATPSQVWIEATVFDYNTSTPAATNITGMIPTPLTQDPTTLRTATHEARSSPNSQHIVEIGETLSSIARLYNLSAFELARANNLSNSIIVAGQVLTLPLPTATVMPSATIDTDDETAVFRSDLIRMIPPPPPNGVNGLGYQQFFNMSPTVIANIQDIYENGQALGRDAQSFTRVGDSTIEPPHFFYRFDSEPYDLGDYVYLQRTIDYYSGSFAHDSVAVIRGLHSWSVFDPMWSPTSCNGGEHLLECEFRLHNPSIIIIRLGTNDRGIPDLTRENFEAIVEYSIENGVIPILGTKADRFDGESNSTNTIIRETAQAYNVPLWDFDLVASTLPDYGLGRDNVHLSIFYAHDWQLERGFTTGHGLHNLTGLIVLDEIRQVLLND